MECLNPLKRVNSILTVKTQLALERATESLNPLKRVNSILTQVKTQLTLERATGLNPLKRVNSILTKEYHQFLDACISVSQSPQTGQFNSYNK